MFIFLRFASLLSSPLKVEISSVAGILGFYGGLISVRLECFCRCICSLAAWYSIRSRFSSSGAVPCRWEIGGLSRWSFLEGLARSTFVIFLFELFLWEFLLVLGIARSDFSGMYVVVCCTQGSFEKGDFWGICDILSRRVSGSSHTVEVWDNLLCAMVFSMLQVLKPLLISDSVVYSSVHVNAVRKWTYFCKSWDLSWGGSYSFAGFNLILSGP